MRTTIAAVLAAVCGVGVAQEPAKPGLEHEWLKKHEGTWAATMKFGGMESKGTATYKMELGGLWLTSTFEGDMLGQKFSGRGMDTYDPAKKKFTSIWADSMNTGFVLMEGTYDKDKKTLTMTGTGPGPDGPATKFKSVAVYPDDDTETFSMYMGDTKEPSFVIEYKRKK
jgi:hypothetical protein